MNPLLTPPSTRHRIHHPIGPSSQLILPTPPTNKSAPVDLFSSGSTRPEYYPFQITTGPVLTRIPLSLALPLRTPQNSPLESSGTLAQSTPLIAPSAADFASRINNFAIIAAATKKVAHPDLCVVCFTADFTAMFSSLLPSISDEA